MMSTPSREGPFSSSAAPDVDWKRVGLRRTRQREVVLSLVRVNCDHPTAEWIHRKAREIIPDISLATVYRTLRVLKEKGLVHEFSGGNSPSRYDGTRHDHEHIRCVRWGVVVDVDLPEVADLMEIISARTDFRVSVFPLTFHGLCRQCAADVAARRPGTRKSRASESADGAPPAVPGTGPTPGEDEPEDADRQWFERFW